VQFKVTVETPMLGDYRRTHLLSLIGSVRGKVIANGALSDGAQRRFDAPSGPSGDHRAGQASGAGLGTEAA
jgi:hypothetical protein